MASNTHLFYLEINKIKITLKKSLSPSLYHDFFAVIKRCFKTLKIQHAIKLLVLNFTQIITDLHGRKILTL